MRLPASRVLISTGRMATRPIITMTPTIALRVSASDSRFSLMKPRFSVSNQAMFSASISAFMPPLADHSATRIATIPAIDSEVLGAEAMAVTWPAISSSALCGRMFSSSDRCSPMVAGSATMP